MAKKIITELVDDLDRTSTADETVRFALDGKPYVIDLTAGNAEMLRTRLAEFVAAARPDHSVPSVKGARKRSGARRADLSSLRKWAKDNGYPVAARGRVSQQVMAAYEEAQVRGVA